MYRILCFTAHPDDEAGGFGGTLFHYAERGVETHVICLTPGQAATHRGGARSDDELARMRRQEFAASCKLLKVSSGAVLDYPDARLDRQDLMTVVEDLTRRVRKLRPQVIMTMGPEGAITGHPDHTMVSIFATMAFHFSGRTSRFPEQLQSGLQTHCAQKLFYSTTLFTMPDRPPVAQAPSTTKIEIGQNGLDAKVAAFKCHTSQLPLFPYFESMVRKRGPQELFHLAASLQPTKAQYETDLFTGVFEDR
jgi:LmbE family N-acetylglucosaminyl deacetylase